MECETRRFRAACSELSGLTRVWAEEPARGTIAGTCPGSWGGARDQGHHGTNVAGPPDITSSAWEGGEHATGVEAASCAM